MTQTENFIKIIKAYRKENAELRQALKLIADNKRPIPGEHHEELYEYLCGKYELATIAKAALTTIKGKL